MHKELAGVFENIISAADLLYRHGWAEAYAGNISYRMASPFSFDKNDHTDLPDRFENLACKTIMITSSGSRMRHIASGNASDYCSVITVNDKGTGYYRSAEYNKNPSSELVAHLLLHNEYEKRQSGYRAVVHCHPENMVALLNIPDIKTAEAVNKILFSSHSEIRLLLPEGIGIIGHKTPGSYELALAVLNELKKKDLAIIEKHGCFSAGITLDEVLDKIEVVEKAIKIYFRTRQK
ncbi:MAG TPA: rhamnulose-1-phosphate aldolase [Clostridiales bacterium]|jgi:rhamnulose-1-phosphate aldolase|nr:rhamnulose-1-phosphate aldolase [Clostridiales bacterium]HQP70958.1 rhamnulose-1-phosphate aldolase [Clostridiales bacterium]